MITTPSHALNEDVVYRRGDGMHDEPLEQVLLYLGLSMHKNQTVNTSIDGKDTARALIPGHPTNANLWFELNQRTHCSSCSARPAILKKYTCNTTLQQQVPMQAQDHAEARPQDILRIPEKKSL
jgi:hypothetical protein